MARLRGPKRQGKLTRQANGCGRRRVRGFSMRDAPTSWVSRDCRAWSLHIRARVCGEPQASCRQQGRGGPGESRWAGKATPRQKKDRSTVGRDINKEGGVPLNKKPSPSGLVVRAPPTFVGHYIYVLSLFPLSCPAKVHGGDPGSIPGMGIPFSSFFPPPFFFPPCHKALARVLYGQDTFTFACVGPGHIMDAVASSNSKRENP